MSKPKERLQKLKTLNPKEYFYKDARDILVDEAIDYIAELQAENEALRNRIRILEEVIRKHCPEQKTVKLSKP